LGHPLQFDSPNLYSDADLDSLIVGRDETTVLEKLARQVPLGRLGEAGDVASAIVYLASDESCFVTGSEIKLNGGISAM
jgi:NAD(P)-dependent dehydrogenase (short-subunit alcohol dehydrogenase family)